jgi:hypothetical protein
LAEHFIAVPVCAHRNCVVLACEAGRGDCNGLFIDGCEQDLTTDVNCGLCRRVCQSGTHCAANADSGAAGWTCQ